MDHDALRRQLDELRSQLENAEGTLNAIRNGEVDAVVVTGRNGTRIYSLEGADHPYRILVEAMQQGAVTLSADGLIMYANRSFGEMVKLPHDHLIGKSIDTFFSPTDQAAVRRLAGETEQGRHQQEFLLRTEDGSDLPVLVSFNYLQLDGTWAMCLVITDLTENRQNQALRDSDRRKDEFLAMLAHELRNPLAPISNAAQLLVALNRDASEDTKWACEVVERQVRQMSRIVDDLLDVSRITRGKINLQMMPTEISSVVATAVETSRPLIESRNHQLCVTLSPEPLRVLADMTRLSQVVVNLLNNAAKYTDVGGVIRLNVDRDDGEVVIRVQDNGLGMPAEVLSNVFDLFTQVDRSIDRSQGGLGIGLTLVRSLVELHRGTVKAESDGPGQGSQFIVRLPLLKSPYASSIPPGALTNGVPPQRVLVVDDNVDSARSLAILLKSTGHETQLAHDGHAAIEAAQRWKPTIILLDIGLPGMDGYSVAEHLRKQPDLNGVVLAALTGYGDDDDRRRSKRAGFDHHLVKPASFSTLQELFRSIASHQAKFAAS